MSPKEYYFLIWNELSLTEKRDIIFDEVLILKDDFAKVNPILLDDYDTYYNLKDRRGYETDWRLILIDNPSIFTVDYEYLKDRMWKYGFGKELMENRFHPDNFSLFYGWGFNQEISKYLNI